jgi:hypothetical protein
MPSHARWLLDVGCWTFCLDSVSLADPDPPNAALDLIEARWLTRPKLCTAAALWFLFISWTVTQSVGAFKTTARQAPV